MQERTLLRFEPMTFSKIIDTSIRLYLQNFSLILGINVVAHLPYLIVSIVMPYVIGFNFMDPTADFEAIGAESGFIFAQIGLMFLLLFILYYLIALPLSVGATTYAISERYLQKPVSTIEAIQTVRRRYKTLLWVQIVTGVIVVLSWGLSSGILAAVLGGLGGNALGALGFLAGMVLGVIVLLSYALVAPVVMLEDSNARASRRRSWTLVAGSRWKIFAVLFVLWLICSTATSAVQVVLTLLVAGESFALSIMLNVVQQLVWYAAVPVIMISLALIYYDLRIRKEGFDLEMLSQSLSQP